ncbi:MAG: PAS domain-containing protein [Bacteroidota bacterium]
MWTKEFNAAITICNADGKIIEMNEKAAEIFKEDGGYELIGKNLFECHSEQSNKIIKEMISEKKTNVYTIEKNGTKKLIYQAPWFESSEFKGLVELSIEIPFDMPHHIRS